MPRREPDIDLERDIPAPAPARPIPAEPVLPVAARPQPNMEPKPEVRPEPISNTTPALSPADLRIATRAEEPAAAPRVEPKFGPTRPAQEPVAPAPKPAMSDFDFDFGFNFTPPAPAQAPVPSPQPQQRPQVVVSAEPAAPAAPAPQAEETGDPIADLIAAELDGLGVGKPASDPEPQALRPSVTPRPVMQAPQPRPQVAPSAPSAPAVAMAAPQRPLGFEPPQPRAAGPTSAMPKPEENRPAAEPVFFTPPRPERVAPVERDPMEEIESLIGEAVRLELAAPEKPVPSSAPTPAPAPEAEAAPVPTPPSAPEPAAAAPAPTVPPLTTGFAPRRATIKDADSSSAAEAAILAAAAASGAEVGRVEPSVIGEANPYKRPKAKPEHQGLMQGGLRQYVGMAVAGTLLLAAGFGLYWVVGLGHNADTQPPVLAADTTPVKAPPPAVPAKSDPQGSVVFGELEGNKTPPADEQLVSRDDSTATSVADVAKPVGTDGAASSESELANRKVRTVTVRPDGSIVSGDDAVAGTEELPVNRPNVPELPGSDVQPSELLASLPTNDGPSAPTPANDPIGSLAAEAGAPATAVPTPAPGASIDPTLVAPVPMARPVDRTTLGGGVNQRVASAPAAAPLELAPPAATAPASAAPVSTSGPYVQLSSQPTQADAQASLARTQRQLAALLNGRSLAVRQVDLGARGTWYRVILPVESFQEATQTCAAFKANGQDCVPIGG